MKLIYCRKRKYISEGTANEELGKIFELRKKNKKYKKWKLKRSYKCGICGFWHLTSQEKMK